LFRDEGEHRNDVDWFTRGLQKSSRRHEHDPRMGGES